MSPWLTVVGIGEDGFAGLGRAARRALLHAETIVGGERHLALLPSRLRGRGQPWPTPFSIAPVLALRGGSVCVLASGDPMLHGVGATFARSLATHEYTVLPAPSSYSLAASRLGWALQDVALASLVGKPLSALHRLVTPGARLLVLSGSSHDPAALAALLVERGFGPSPMTVLEHLGGPKERIVSANASNWSMTDVAALNLMAIECQADADARCWPNTPGLPDHAYLHDGQLTKRDVRAIVLARLAPLSGECLWDVGAGCGSIGIEWMRSDAACRALAIEADAGRRDLIARNRDALGVPLLRIVAGRAPEALTDLPAPDAIFIGGGVTEPGVLAHCWAQLKAGGRLVANAVTLQSEAVLIDWHARHGGALSRIAIAHAAPLGDFDTWRQALPITLLEARKPRRDDTNGGADA
jgi:precorrin-6Y C5,15-methyltransferase (decarboxylating)